MNVCVLDRDGRQLGLIGGAVLVTTLPKSDATFQDYDLVSFDLASLIYVLLFFSHLFLALWFVALILALLC